MTNFKIGDKVEYIEERGDLPPAYGVVVAVYSGDYPYAVKWESRWPYQKDNDGEYTRYDADELGYDTRKAEPEPDTVSYLYMTETFVITVEHHPGSCLQYAATVDGPEGPVGYRSYEDTRDAVLVDCGAMIARHLERKRRP